MNGKALIFFLLLSVVCIFFAFTRDHWQALANFLFFALIAAIAVRPVGLYIGDFFRRMADKDNSRR